MFTRVFIVTIIAFIFTQSFSQDTSHTPLAEDNEFVLLSFVIENSSKIFTIAAAEDGSYIVHRFGEEDNIEIEYPAKTEDSWDKFLYSHYSRAVGNSEALLDLNYLEFTYANSRYFVYDSFSEEFIKSFVGATVTNLSSGEELNLQAASQVKIGNLSRLILNSQIESQSALKAQVPSTPGQTIVVEGSNENNIALIALEGDLQTIEAELANVANRAQQSLDRVERGFQQLKDDTLNVQTNIAFWTPDNETQLGLIQAQARTLASNQQAANQLITQFKLANAIESKTEYLIDISAYGETIKTLGTELERLETTAILSFNDSRIRYFNR